MCTEAKQEEQDSCKSESGEVWIEQELHCGAGKYSACKPPHENKRLPTTQADWAEAKAVYSSRISSSERGQSHYTTLHQLHPTHATYINSTPPPPPPLLNFFPTLSAER